MLDFSLRKKLPYHALVRPESSKFESIQGCVRLKEATSIERFYPGLDLGGVNFLHISSPYPLYWT